MDNLKNINVPWQCSSLTEASYVSNILHSDWADCCFSLSVCLKSYFISNSFSFILSQLAPFIIFRCLSGDLEMKRETTCKHSDWLHFLSITSAARFFSWNSKIWVAAKPGRSYLSNWLDIFSSALHALHVLASQKLWEENHPRLTEEYTKSKNAWVNMFVYPWHSAATAACNHFKAKQNCVSSEHGFIHA